MMDSKWRRLARKISGSDDSKSDAEAVKTVEAQCGPISDLSDRCVGKYVGTVRGIHQRDDSKAAPALVAELDDGTGEVSLVWLGRRSIAGMEPGVRIMVQGRVTHCHGTPTIFNPRYEIVPTVKR